MHNNCKRCRGSPPTPTRGRTTRGHVSVPDAASVKLSVHRRCITKTTKPASAIWMIPMTCLCSHSLMSERENEMMLPKLSSRGSMGKHAGTFALGGWASFVGQGSPPYPPLSPASGCEPMLVCTTSYTHTHTHTNKHTHTHTQTDTASAHLFCGGSGATRAPQRP